MFDWLKKLWSGLRARLQGAGAMGNEKQEDKDTLSALTRGIQYAVSSTSVMLAGQYIQLLGQFFLTEEEVEKELKKRRGDGQNGDGGKKGDGTGADGNKPGNGTDGKPGKLYARMVYLELSPTHTVAVPLISLVSPKGLALDKMRVELSVRVDDTNRKAATSKADKYDGERVSMDVTVAPKTRYRKRRSTDVVDIVMEFAAGEPPEAMMRIIDDFTNRVLPMKSKDENNVDQVEKLMNRYPPVSLAYEEKKKPDDTKKDGGAAGGNAPPAPGGTPPGGP